MNSLRTREPSIASVFITDELERRPPRTTDYLQEKLAFQDLAARMDDQPQDMLPRFVDLAMQMTGGVSAGLSLLEENPPPAVFRWQYLRGVLSPFDGTTTPRNFSPCGITLDRNGPVLSAHPERVYSWIAEANITVPEVLLVPLYLGGTTPLGTLWIVSDEKDHFDSGHARAMTELASFVGIALRMARSEQRLQSALDEQEMLAKEMSHRVKNLFAMIGGMVYLSARTSATKEEMARMLSGRIIALSNAHALVRRSFAVTRPEHSTPDLATLVRAIVEPHDTHASRFLIEGPSMRCGEHATNRIALVVHELATNATKYGALTVDRGRVNISWKRDGENLILHWVERGGPGIDTPPTTSGFGSTLAHATIVRGFGGTLSYEWQRAGLDVTITLPIHRLSA
jgi:two-component sensor histidine kinase